MAPTKGRAKGRKMRCVEGSGREAVILAGGRSSRMGRAKSGIVVDGQTILERIGTELEGAGFLVSILGGDPVERWPQIPDSVVHSGPLAALADYSLQGEALFVASCDMPLFRGAAAIAVFEALGDAHACMPTLGGRAQPLCAAYSAGALARAREMSAQGETRVMKWVESLDTLFLDEEDLRNRGVDPNWVRSANTLSELEAILEDA
ncbi:molybdenum cofactor guanylyltransferase [Fimbriimonadia bacterium ATM]|nr:MAG: molybdenum cofactor guanylyltransferase [Armatimonadota bacterium]MBC6969083.1 molybdenum cofactor guanylyltransferase [Armatimonadota bacterium]MCE7900474.1 molybdenum cofactor guanylyltransferase [Armatimonadetes bacterium ATM1]MDL1928365.1 molybdenum cofactor guanylyltransferase [Fimbriimonadia bacterium ATM]RIJ94934.1 MAG: hypothetical protein DCC45_11430 [Armatimonadota bacterium]